MSSAIPGPDHSMNWDEIAAALFAAKGIRSGLWRLAVKLRFAGLTSGWTDDGGTTLVIPTGLIGLDGLVLFRATEAGPMVFDAAPAKPQTTRAAKRAIPRRKAAGSGK